VGSVGSTNTTMVDQRTCNIDNSFNIFLRLISQALISVQFRKTCIYDGECSPIQIQGLEFSTDDDESSTVSDVEQSRFRIIKCYMNSLSLKFVSLTKHPYLRRYNTRLMIFCSSELSQLRGVSISHQYLLSCFLSLQYMNCSNSVNAYAALMGQPIASHALFHLSMR